MRVLLLLLFIVLLSGSASAECRNKIASSELPAAVAQTPSAGSKICGDEDPCVCFDGIDFSVAELVEVDDPSRPKFTKRQVQACDGEAECRAELAALTCSQGQPLIDAAFTQVYCAVQSGFEKMQKLQNSPSKLAAKQTADADRAVREAKIADGRRRQEVGRNIIALITSNNDAKALTPEQTVQLTQALAPIIGLLQTGALQSAKSLVSQLSPSGVITQADIDLTLSQFTAEGY